MLFEIESLSILELVSFVTFDGGRSIFAMSCNERNDLDQKDQHLMIHKYGGIVLPISAMVYFINDLDSQRSEIIIMLLSNEKSNYVFKKIMQIQKKNQHI